MKPIIFNTEMTKAILENRKTVTRRVIKPQPHCYGPNIAYPKHEADFVINQKLNRLQCQTCGTFPEYSREMADNSHFWNPPYRPGDILYVRESFCPYEKRHIIDGVKYAYKADATAESERARKDFGYKWRPSIHMPREAARIFLRVMDVRVERLQDITEEQAVKEGFEAIPCDHPGGYPCTDCMNTGYLEPAALEFIEMWGSTIKPKDRVLYGWDANPWVWVIEFERISREEALS